MESPRKRKRVNDSDDDTEQSRVEEILSREMSHEFDKKNFEAVNKDADVLETVEFSDEDEEMPDLSTHGNDKQCRNSNRNDNNRPSRKTKCAQNQQAAEDRDSSEQGKSIIFVV